MDLSSSSIIPYLAPTTSTSLNAEDPLSYLFPPPSAEGDDTAGAASKIPTSNQTLQQHHQQQQHPTAPPHAPTILSLTSSLPLSHSHALPTSSLPMHQPQLQQQQKQQSTSASLSLSATQQQQHHHAESYLDSSPPAHSIYDASLSNASPYSLSLLPAQSPGNHAPVSMASHQSPSISLPMNYTKPVHQSNMMPVKLEESLQISNTSPTSPAGSLPQHSTIHPSPPPHHQVLVTPSPSIPSPATTATPSHLLYTPSPVQQQQQHQLPMSSSSVIMKPVNPVHYSHQQPYHQSTSSVTPINATLTPPASRSTSLTYSCGASTGGSTSRLKSTNATGNVRVMNNNNTTNSSSKRVVKRDRSLQVMKAIANNNAPDVSLNDDELTKIGKMHESEEHLFQSKELYKCLALFKRTLSKCGYKMAALHLDCLPVEESLKSYYHPFDFVLKKNNTSATTTTTIASDRTACPATSSSPLHQYNNGVYTSSTSQTTNEFNNNTHSSSKPLDKIPQPQQQQFFQNLNYQFDQLHQNQQDIEQSPVSVAAKENSQSEDLIQLNDDVIEQLHNDNNRNEDKKDSVHCDSISTGKRRRSIGNTTSDCTGAVADPMGLRDDEKLLDDDIMDGFMKDDNEYDGSEMIDMEEEMDENDISMDGTTVKENVEHDELIRSKSRPRKRARISSSNNKGNGEQGNKGLESSTEKLNSNSINQDKLGCVVCGKAMSDLDTLVRHFRHVHQELKPFSCPRCHGYYSSEGTLWHHIRNVHSETPRKYRCDFCDASYDSFGAKTRHEHGTHNRDKPKFRCTFENCERVFSFPAHLEAHAQKAHAGFRPFGCQECPKRFPSANGLTRHTREVHLRPQAYSCSCSKRYSKRCHLKRHLIRVHGMSVERVQEEMRKQPHPGLLHMVPKAPPASIE